MGFDPDDLYYEFGGITSVSDAIGRFCRDMDQELNAVDAKFNQMLQHGWQGKAANEFGIMSKKWHAAADDMKNTLHLLGTKVQLACDQAQGADNRCAARIAG